MFTFSSLTFSPYCIPCVERDSFLTLRPDQTRQNDKRNKRKNSEGKKKGRQPKKRGDNNLSSLLSRLVPARCYPSLLSCRLSLSLPCPGKEGKRWKKEARLQAERGDHAVSLEEENLAFLYFLPSLPSAKEGDWCNSCPPKARERFSRVTG